VSALWRPWPAAAVGRRSALRLLAAGSVAALAACTEHEPRRPPGPAGAGFEGVGPIVFAAPPDLGQGGQRRLAVQRWTERHPGRRADYVELPLRADLQRAELLTRLQARSPGYDVLGLDVVWTAELAKGGHIMPLSPVAGSLGLDAFLPRVLDTARFEGELWAVPAHVNAGLLYYNTDVISSPPTTWDELAEQASDAARRRGVDGYVGQLARYEGLTVNLAEAVWYQGGELVKDQRVTADQPAAVRGLAFLAGGIQRGWIPRHVLGYFEKDSLRRFQEGRAAFMRNWPYAYDALQARDSPVRGRFGVVRLPGVSALGGMNLAISRYSRYKRTALEFIRFMTSPEVQTRIFERGGYPAVLASVYEDRRVQARKPYTEALRKSIETAASRPVTPYYGQVTRVIQEAAYNALQGRREPGQAMEQLAADLRIALSGG
jgi:multiple sugar transport system substrate-binding protein